MNQFRTVDIFNQRLKEHIKMMVQLYKSAIDWVIWLYLIIPFMLILGFNYYKWWIEPWKFQISITSGLMVIFSILFFLITNGKIRYFLERGDQLFFRQYEKAYRKLKRYGMVYSLVVHFLLVFCFFLILAPIALVQFDIPLTMYVCLFLVVFMSRIFIATVNQLLSLRWQGWKYYIIKTLCLMIFGSLYSSTLYLSFLHNKVFVLYFAVLLVTGIAVISLKYRLSLVGTFEQDIVSEVVLKYRLVSFALQSAGMIGAPKFQRLKSEKTRKRPWLFRKSGALFKERTGKKAYLELHIKYILRNKSKWVILLQLLGTSCFALLIAPKPLKWIIWILGIIVFNQFNRSFTNEINRSTFLKSFHWNEKQLHEFSTNSIFWTNLPFMIFFGAWLGFLLFPWWGIIAFSLLTVLISNILQLFTVS